MTFGEYVKRLNKFLKENPESKKMPVYYMIYKKHIDKQFGLIPDEYPTIFWNKIPDKYDSVLIN